MSAPQSKPEVREIIIEEPEPEHDNGNKVSTQAAAVSGNKDPPKTISDHSIRGTVSSDNWSVKGSGTGHSSQAVGSKSHGRPVATQKKPSTNLSGIEKSMALRSKRTREGRFYRNCHSKRIQTHKAHRSLRSAHVLEGQKHRELIYAEKAKKPYGDSEKLDDLVEKLLDEEKTSQRANAFLRRTQDDCLNLYNTSTFNNQIPKLSVAFLDDHKQKKHQCLEKLLDSFCEQHSMDLAVMCHKNPDVFQQVNLRGSKSFQVGDGSYGSVYKIVNLDKHIYARKRILYKNEFEKNEVKHLHELGCCDHIPSCQNYFPVLYGFSRERGQIYIKKEFIETTWREVDIKDKMMIWVMFKEGLTALSCLDKHKIYHRDIKPKNIGCRENCSETKILDFGSSQNPGQHFNENGMTAAYMPPEAVQGKNHEKSDIWALALGVMFLITRKHPYQDQREYRALNSAEEIKELIRKQPGLAAERVKKHIAAGDWRKLLLAMLSKNAEERPSPADALKHRLFSEQTAPDCIDQEQGEGAVEAGNVLSQAKVSIPAFRS